MRPRNKLTREQKAELIKAKIYRWMEWRSTKSGPGGVPLPPPANMAEHTCTISVCKDYIETIDEDMRVYGCLLSGITHVCQPKFPQLCWAKYTFEGCHFCVFSKIELDRTLVFSGPKISKKWMRRQLTDCDIYVPEIIQEEEEEMKEKAKWNVAIEKEENMGSSFWSGVSSTIPIYKLGHYNRCLDRVVSEEMTRGSMYIDFCTELERMARECVREMLFHSESRNMLEIVWKNTALDKSKQHIQEYAQVCEKNDIAINMHIMDNIYRSYQNLYRNKTKALPENGQVYTYATEHVCKLAVSLWLIGMVAIGGFPFKSSERGNSVIDHFTQGSEKENKIFRKLSGKVNEQAYKRCVQKFTADCIIRMASMNDVHLLFNNQPYTHPVFPAEPLFRDVLPNAEVVKELRKISRAKYLTDNAIAEGRILGHRLFQFIDLAHLHEMCARAIDAVRAGEDSNNPYLLLVEMYSKMDSLYFVCFSFFLLLFVFFFFFPEEGSSVSNLYTLFLSGKSPYTGYVQA